MAQRALTPEEQGFATKYHNLIYSFLHHRHLSVDGFYDVVAFGFLTAVRRYHEQPHLHRYQFSTIAYKCMNSSVADHYVKQNRLKRRGHTVSLDDAAGPGCSISLAEVVPDPTHDDTVVICIDLWERIAKAITSEKQRKALALRNDGYSNKEIAKLWGVKEVNVERLLALARQRITTGCIM